MKSQIIVLLNPIGNVNSIKENTAYCDKKNFRRMINSKLNILFFIKQIPTIENILEETTTQEFQQQGSVIQYIYIVQKQQKFGIESFKNIIKILKSKELENKLSILFQLPIDQYVEEVKQSIRSEFDFYKWWPLEQLAMVAEQLSQESAIEKLSLINSRYPMAVLFGPSGQGKSLIFSKIKQCERFNIQTDNFDYVQVLDKFILVDSPPLIWNNLDERNLCLQNFRCFFSHYSKRISNLFLVIKYDRIDMMKNQIKEIFPLLSEIQGSVIILVLCEHQPDTFQQFCQEQKKLGFKNCIYIILSETIAEQIEQNIFYDHSGIILNGAIYEDDYSEQTNNLNKVLEEAVQQFKDNVKFNEDARFNFKQTNKGKQLREESELKQKQAVESLLFHSYQVQYQANIIKELKQKEKEQEQEQEQKTKDQSPSENIRQQILDKCNCPAQEIDIKSLLQLVFQLETAQQELSKANQKKENDQFI